VKQLLTLVLVGMLAVTLGCGGTPTSSKGPSTDTGKAPSDTGKAPTTDTGKKPMDTGKAPTTDTGKKPPPPPPPQAKLDLTAPAEMKLEPGKTGDITVKVTLTGDTGEPMFKVEADKDSGITVETKPEDIKADAKGEAKITLKAGDKEGDFTVKITATGKDAKLTDTADVKVSVKKP
jgi:hypothetical protein